MKNEGEDLFNSFFGGLLSDFKIGDKVFAQLDPHTSVNGVIKYLPSIINSFYTVDGVVTRLGVKAINSNILVPKNFLKHNA